MPNSKRFDLKLKIFDLIQLILLIFNISRFYSGKLIFNNDSVAAPLFEFD